MEKVSEKFELEGQWKVLDSRVEDDDMTWSDGFDFGCAEPGVLSFLLLAEESANPDYQSGQYYKYDMEATDYSCKYDKDGNFEMIECERDGLIMEFKVEEIIDRDNIKVSVDDGEGGRIINVLQRIPTQPVLAMPEEEYEEEDE